MIDLGAPRHFFASTTSTMDRLTEVALQGAPEGTVVVAAEQIAGRGRAGRSWTAPPGSSLLMSVLLRPAVTPADLPPLPLIAGLAIAEGIEAHAGTPLSLGLKWPNDIFLNDAKLAGVLMQSRSGASGVEFVNLGVGINVNVPAGHLPAGATSLTEATGEAWTIDDLEQSVLAALSRRYAEFLEQGSVPGLTDWFDRALYRDEIVRIELDGAAVEGRFTGIAPNGALVLESATGSRQIVAGDLVRGPRRPKSGDFRHGDR